MPDTPEQEVWTKRIAWSAKKVVLATELVENVRRLQATTIELLAAALEGAASGPMDEVDDAVLIALEQYRTLLADERTEGQD